MSKTCEKCIHYDICRYPLEYRAYPETCWKYEEERPHGEWKPIVNDIDLSKCSECGCVTGEKYHFCPNCGADMRKEGDVEC